MASFHFTSSSTPMADSFEVSSQLSTLTEHWRFYSNCVNVGVASAGLLLETEETARRYPARLGIVKPRRKTLCNSGRVNVGFEKLTSRLSDKEFRNIFRMTRIDFYELLELVRPRITKNIEMGKKGGNETVSPDTRLAITLRMLAGARYGDLMLLYAVKKSTVYEIFHDTLEALDEALKLPLLPDSDEGLRRLADGMKLSRARGSPLTGCIGALDGICIKIEKPKSDMNPALFYCRKGYYAILVQAVVDFSYRFLCASANCAGSTHDSLAHAVSKLGLYLSQGSLDKPYWLSGDEAYICTESVLTPYPASQAAGFIFRLAFNYFLSSLRIHVEQAFGMLKAKWLISDHLKFDTQKCSKIIIMTMKLHNYCIDQGGQPRRKHSRPQAEMDRIMLEADDWYLLAKQDEFDRVDSFGQCSTFGEPSEANFANAVSIKREHFVAHLEALGLTRPEM